MVDLAGKAAYIPSQDKVMYHSCQPYTRKGPKAFAKAVPVMPFAVTVFCGIAAAFSLLLRGLS